MKKKLFLFSLIILAFFITGCQKKEKLFEKNDFKITLTDDFKEDTYEKANYYFISNDAAVTALKESFELLSQIDITSDSPLEDYANAVLKANNKDEVLIKEDGFSYFTYTNEVNSNTFFYISVLKKGKDGFWLINFMCLDKDKNNKKDEFLKFAKSIEV